MVNINCHVQSLAPRLKFHFIAQVVRVFEAQISESLNFRSKTGCCLNF